MERSLADLSMALGVPNDEDMQMLSNVAASICRATPHIPAAAIPAVHDRVMYNMTTENIYSRLPTSMDYNKAYMELCDEAALRRKRLHERREAEMRRRLARGISDTEVKHISEWAKQALEGGNRPLALPAPTEEEHNDE